MRGVVRVFLAPEHGRQPPPTGAERNRAKNKDDRDSQKFELDFERARDEGASGFLKKMNRKDKKAYIKKMGFTGKNRPKSIMNIK